MRMLRYTWFVCPYMFPKYTAADQARLLADAGIVRNKAKVAAAINNAS
jgi:3-methyladenine DNA glycosylase Tag